MSKNCVKGYSCGETCINVGFECRVMMSFQAVRLINRYLAVLTNNEIQAISSE